MLIFTATELLKWVLTFLSGFILLCYVRYRKKYKNYPPGPMGLPIVGYLPFLNSKIHKDFTQLSKKYGDVFSLSFGVYDVVILNGPEAIRQALSENNLCNRPPGVFHLSAEYKTLLELEYKDWKEHKRFNGKVLKALGTGQNQVEELARAQIDEVLEQLSNNIGSDINIRKVLEIPMINIINLMITGKVFDKSDPMLDVMADFQEIMYLIQPTSYVVNIPLLTPFFFTMNKPLHKALAAVTLIAEDLRSEISQHSKFLNESNLNDYLDHFLLEMKKKNGSNDFTKETAIGIAQTFLIAGSDTTKAAVEFALMQMALDQDIQEKVYREIVSVFGTEISPTWKDKEKLPYTDAVLLESNRRNGVAAVGLARCANENVKIMGFDIPKGTKVIPNLAGAHMDPRFWNQPELFIPERFLTEDGKVLTKLPAAYMPFSTGKRACPGDRLALIEAFAFFVSIVQRFRILPPTGGVRMESINRGILSPRYPFCAVEKR